MILLEYSVIDPSQLERYLCCILPDNNACYNSNMPNVVACGWRPNPNYCSPHPDLIGNHDLIISNNNNNEIMWFCKRN